MPKLRQDDRVAELLLACPRGAPAGMGIGSAVAGAPLEARVYALDPPGHDLRPTSGRKPDLEAPHANFLLNLVGDDLVLVVGEEVTRIPRTEDVEGLQRRLRERVLEAQRAATRRRKRSNQLDTHLLLSERLVRATSPADVWAALLAHTTDAVGGSATLILVRSQTSETSGASEWKASSELEGPLPELPADLALRLATTDTPTLIEREHDDPHSMTLGPLLRATGGIRIACSGLGRHGLLFAVERRASRDFGADDWHLLRLISRQAELSLDRVSPGKAPG